MTFRERLRDELKYKNISLKELSFLTGIPKGTLDTYTNSRAQVPNAEIAVKIAKALDVSVEFLITGETSQEICFTAEEYIIMRNENKYLKAELDKIKQAISNLSKYLD